jgi:phosphoglycolate phosphatase
MNGPSRYPLLVFDWDGTLIDSAAVIVKCIQAACADMALPIPDDLRAAHVIGLGLGDALAYVTPGLARHQYALMVERYRHHYLLQDPDISLFEGTRQMLVDLRDKGHVLAIATGKSHAGLMRALETTGTAEFFAATRCADRCASKPAPDMLHELMAELDAPAGQTLMIGDTVHDLRMAANAGVDAVAVCHGAHPKANLLELTPVACLENTGELDRWLKLNA